MKLVESVIVVVIFFFLLVFGIGFYVSFSQSAGKEKAGQRSSLYAVEAMQRVKSMPELQCTREGMPVADCFDAYKIDAFKSLLESEPGYAGRYKLLYPSISISINKVYPDEEDRQNIYNGTPKGAGVGGADPYRLPIVIFNPSDDFYSFGYSTVEVYHVNSTMRVYDVS